MSIQNYKNILTFVIKCVIMQKIQQIVFFLKGDEKMEESISEDSVIQLIQVIKDLNANLQNLKTTTDEPRFLFAKDVSKKLKINVNDATKLMKQENFPSIKGAGRLKVEKQAFNEWCRNAQKND